MPRPLNELIASFAKDRFGSPCGRYRSYVQEMLSIPGEVRQASLDDYYDTLQDMIDGLLDNCCGGTLSVEERAGVFRMILEDWSDESPGSLRASMVWIASALRPCEGVSEWLREVAGRQADPQYAQYLRECADTIWDKPGT